MRSFASLTWPWRRRTSRKPSGFKPNMSESIPREDTVRCCVPRWSVWQPNWHRLYSRMKRTLRGISLGVEMPAMSNPQSQTRSRMRPWAKMLTRLLSKSVSAALAALGLLLWTSLAAAKPPSWYLQLSAPTADERAARQAIALELSEIDIPADPLREAGHDGEVSLHIEVTEAERRFVVVLWDRGELAGRRVVSASGEPRVITRRLGLVVAELARDLRDRRLRAARMFEQERRFVERRALVSAYRAQQRALGLRAGLRTEVAPEGAFLLGPTVGAEFNNHFPLRLVTGLSWGAGQVFGLSPDG